DFFRVGDRAAAEFHDDHRGDIKSQRVVGIKLQRRQSAVGSPQSGGTPPTPLRGASGEVGRGGGGEFLFVTHPIKGCSPPLLCLHRTGGARGFAPCAPRRC